MPLDLGLWECLWTDDGDDSGESCDPFNRDHGLRFATLLRYKRVFLLIFIALNPDPRNLPKLDPKDQSLLGDSAGVSTLFVNSSTGGPSSSHTVPAVTWLRKTEYITSREGATRPSSTSDQCVALSVHEDSDTDESPLVYQGKTWRKPPSTFQDQHKYAISRPPSMLVPRTSIWAHSNIRTNPTSPPSGRMRSSRTLTSGQTRTICSGSQSGQERGLQMYASI